MHMKLSNIYNTRKMYDFKNGRSWQAWNVLYIFPLHFFFFKLWGKNTYFFWKIVEYTYGSIHFSGTTELIDLQTSCSNSFSSLKQSTNKTEIKFYIKIQNCTWATKKVFFWNLTRTNTKTINNKKNAQLIQIEITG